MQLNSKLFFLVNLILCFSATVSAIQCYQCNSITDEECGDIANLPLESVNHLLKDCEGDFHGKYPFCRTIDFTIHYNKNKRIIRTCGWEASNETCYRVDNDSHLEVVCECFTDGCNTGYSNIIQMTSVGSKLKFLFVAGSLILLTRI